MNTQKRPSKPLILLGKMLLFAQERLAKALGPKRTEEVLRGAITHFGERPMETPQDLLELSEFLRGGGGLVKAVGDSLKSQALLRGATEQQA
jgi:hypothetical protein